MALQVQRILENLNEVLETCMENGIQMFLGARLQDSFFNKNLCMTEPEVFNRIKDSELITVEGGRVVVRDYICGEHLSGHKTITFVVPELGSAVMDCKSTLFEVDGPVGTHLFGLFAEHSCHELETTIRGRTFPRLWTMRNLRKVFDEILLKDRDAILILKDIDTNEFVCGPLGVVTVGTDGPVVVLTMNHSRAVFNSAVSDCLTNLVFHSVVPSRPEMVEWTLNSNFEYTVFSYSK